MLNEFYKAVVDDYYERVQRINTKGTLDKETKMMFNWLDCNRFQLSKGNYATIAHAINETYNKRLEEIRDARDAEKLQR